MVQHRQNATHSTRDLRIAALAEGMTLVLLVLVAVPLDRLTGCRDMVTAMGPIHGTAFLVYWAAIVEALSAGLIGPWMALRAFVLSLIPTGTFWNDRALRRIEQKYQTDQTPMEAR